MTLLFQTAVDTVGESHSVWYRIGVIMVLCLVGLFGYSMYSVKKHVFSNSFSWAIFFNENKIFWIWAILIQLMFAGVMGFYPGLEQWLVGILIKTTEAIAGGVVGTDIKIPVELGSVVVYLTSTWQLSRLANKSVKPENKIGTKKATD